MNGCLLPGPRGRRWQNWQKDRPCGLPALPSPWSTVELATSSFRWGPVPQPSVAYGTAFLANRRVKAKRPHSDKVHPLHNRVS